ncbi:hypothetical protein MASR2M18_02570 [Ignavibacteria bacterium]|nr:hypothetical protein [Bacteroidota bacterium]
MSVVLSSSDCRNFGTCDGGEIRMVISCFVKLSSCNKHGIPVGYITPYNDKGVANPKYDIFGDVGLIFGIHGLSQKLKNRKATIVTKTKPPELFDRQKQVEKSAGFINFQIGYSTQNLKTFNSRISNLPQIKNTIISAENLVPI